MIALVFLLMLLPVTYVWWHFLRDVNVAWQILFFLPLIAIIVLMTLVQTPMYQAWMFRTAMVMILCYLAPQVFFMLMSAIGWGLSRWMPAAWRVMNTVGVLLALTVLGIIAYGLTVGWKKLVVTNVELTFHDLPAGFDGYRIVQLSDLHIGTYEPAPECVARIVSETNALHPDLICFTGDLVNSSPKEVEAFTTELRKLKAKDGIYSIMGNHDYCTYAHYDRPSQQAAAVRELQQIEAGYGWTMLNNDNRILRHNGDSLLLAGVENSSKPPFPDYGNLKKAIGDRDTLFTILLSHDPSHWRRKVLGETKAQLMLAGHTHSGQFSMFGWSPTALTSPEYCGLYEMTPDGTELFNPAESAPANRKLYVSAGAGGNVAFRFGVWPEIVVITLHRAK